MKLIKTTTGYQLNDDDNKIIANTDENFAKECHIHILHLPTAEKIWNEANGVVDFQKLAKETASDLTSFTNGFVICKEMMKDKKFTGKQIVEAVGL